MHFGLHRTLLSTTVHPFHPKLVILTRKSHVTYKGLFGVSPSSSITFVVYCKVRKSGTLEKEFWNPGDSVMADRGFTIESDLKELKVNLNIPSCLGGRAQLTAAEVKESQTIV